MRITSSRKSVNPFAVTAPASVINAALFLAAFIDKRTDTPARIIADDGRITFSGANLRSAIAITALVDANADHRVLIRHGDELDGLRSYRWHFGIKAAA